MNVVEYIAKNNLLKDIISNVSRKNGAEENLEDLKDLEQDLYVYLLTHITNEELEELISKNELRYYLARIVTNNINSKTSNFFYKYKKNKMINIDEINWQNIEDEEEGV